MNKDELYHLAEEYVTTTPYNFVGPHFSDAEGYYGMRIYNKPLMSVAPADDPLFESLLDPKVVGPHMLMPNEWLPEAKSVVAFFLPATKWIKEGNQREPVAVSKEWLLGRTDANLICLTLSEYICEKLNEAGFKTCIPQNDPRFILRSAARNGINDATLKELGLKNVYNNYQRKSFFSANASDFPVYNSNWSERHVAYVCGLGTFGVSTNLITKAGTTGRFVSLVTDWVPNQYDVREYSNWMEYCNRCGACIKRCPGHSITMTGKNKMMCHDHVESVGFAAVPRYGCGKCQTGIPCEDGIPPKRRNET